MRTNVLKFFSTVLVVSALILAWTSCSNNDEPKANSKITLKLTDTPSFLYSEVNIDIRGIDVYVGNTMQGSAEVKDGWLKLDLQSTGVVNLLDFMHGESKLMVDQKIASCHITKVRFNLGADCSVKSLLTNKTSSLSTSGSFTFEVDWNIKAGEEYAFMIDIDASQSVSLDLQFNPEPYIRAFAESFGGNVSGYVHPAVAVRHIEITNGETTLYTIADVIAGSLTGTGNGYFAFICLQPGDWTVKFVTKSASGYQNKEVKIKVTTGQTYKIPDVVELSK